MQRILYTMCRIGLRLSAYACLRLYIMYITFDVPNRPIIKCLRLFTVAFTVVYGCLLLRLRLPRNLRSGIVKAPPLAPLSGAGYFSGGKTGSLSRSFKWTASLTPPSRPRPRRRDFILRSSTGRDEVDWSEVGG